VPVVWNELIPALVIQLGFRPHGYILRL
jgi:hypothetical protein